jgi:hypothetical protein
MDVGRHLSEIMIVLSIGSSTAYFIEGDIRRGIYWMAAAILTAAVTY